MKLLSKDLLVEYGFTEDKSKAKYNTTVMTRDKLDIVIKEDSSVYYSNMGFDYPLKDLAALRKLYKEVRSEELKPL
jgi:hypothetical protein